MAGIRRGGKICALAYESNGSDWAKLLKILGPAKLKALQKAFAGRRVWIPKPGKEVNCDTCRWRDACIHRWRSRGRSVEQIARRLAISPKTVYRVLRELQLRRP